MQKPQLVQDVQQRSELSKKDSEMILAVILESITDALARGEDVRIQGFGSFIPKQRAQRTGRNPRSGEVIEIAAHNTVVFSPGKNLKEKINLSR